MKRVLVIIAGLMLGLATMSPVSASVNAENAANAIALPEPGLPCNQYGGNPPAGFGLYNTYYSEPGGSTACTQCHYDALELERGGWRTRCISRYVGQAELYIRWRG
jgi:hypothetical protein